MLNRFRKVVRARTRSTFNKLRGRLDLRYGSRCKARADRTPIFILGAPRSGTTLLYQLMVEYFDVGYFANQHLEDPARINRIERRYNPRAARQANSYESNHGETSERWEPHETGPVWNRVIPRSLSQIEDANLTASMVRDTRRLVRGFMRAAAASVVIKNVNSGLRLPLLDAALPEARYIIIERELSENARSLLAGRVKRNQLNDWWSAKPNHAETVIDSAHPADQVVWQVTEMQKIARAELAIRAANRVYVTSYAELAAQPQEVLRSIAEWLAESNAEIGIRSNAHIPREFERRAGGELAPELEAKLREAVTKVSEQDAV